MFSSSPSQQLMLENLRRAKSGKGKDLKKENSVRFSGVDEPQQSSSNDSAGPPKLSDDSGGIGMLNRGNSSDLGSAKASGKSSARRSGKRNKAVKINSESIDEDLDRQDTHGTAIRKIAEAMAGFSVERDGVMLDAFKTRMLEYSNFRMLLKRSLGLTFSDAEFEYICTIFDRDGDCTVDGEEFLVVCKLLAHAWRKRGMKKNKERDKYLECVLKEKSDAEHAERQAYLENAADFVFAKEDEESMLTKIKKAAMKVNKIEPGAPPLHGFEPKYLKPKEALVAIGNAFRVQLNAKELGALIRMFDYDKRGLLNTSTFMVQFSRWGVELRDAHRSMQIEQSKRSAQEMRDYHANVMKAKELQRESGVDMAFSDVDKESALAKLRVAAKGYRKNSASSVPLDGFSSVTISPGMFRDMVKRTFNVQLNPKELGAIVNMFDETGEFEISCKAFLVYFARVGVEERFKDHSAQLQETKEKFSSLYNEHHDKIKQIHEQNLISPDLLLKVTPAERDNALRKLRGSARHYSTSVCSMPGDLDVFKVDKMTPGIFQEKLQKFLNVFLTPVELAACLVEFDTAGDRMYIDCVAFVRFFKKLGFAEKEKLWEEERIRRAQVIEAALEQQKKFREKFVNMVENGAVDYNFTNEDSDSAIKKMEVGASQHDPTNPQAMSLTAFETAYITPGQLKEKLKRTFNIDLTPKELGSIVKTRLEDDGRVSCEVILKLIKDLAKAKKERLRKARLEAELADIEAAKERDKKRAEAKRAAEADRLKHEAEDAKSLMAKLNASAQAFAVDNASFLRVLNAIKVPSLSPQCFISNFYRIFLHKLTQPEVGLLMKTVNPWAASHHLVDGVSFLKGFYRLSRLQQAVLLGQLDENELTVEVLRPDAHLTARVRAALGYEKKGMSTKFVESVIGEEYDTRSGSATSNIRLMPRLAHWAPEQLEEDSRSLSRLRKHHSRSSRKSSDGSLSSELVLHEVDSAGHGDLGDDSSLVSSLTKDKDSVSDIVPMLSLELGGFNPYEEWGLKEAGYLPEWYHPPRSAASREMGSSRSVSTSRLGSSMSLSPSRQINASFDSDTYRSPSEEQSPMFDFSSTGSFSQPISQPVSEPVSQPISQSNSWEQDKAVEFQDKVIFLLSAEQDPEEGEKHETVDSSVAISPIKAKNSKPRSISPPGRQLPRVKTAPLIDTVVDRLLAQNSTTSKALLTTRPISAVSLSPILVRQMPIDVQATANINVAEPQTPGQESSSIPQIFLKEKQQVKQLKQILRPTLPKTFSAVGLARQEVRGQFLVNK